MRGVALVLGGSRWQCDLIRRTRELGLRTIVTDILGSAPGGFLADQFVQIDTNDREGLLKIARETKADIVLADQSDRIVPVAAFLNQQLKLRGIQPDTARKFTDKYAMRQALRGSDVRMPNYAEIASAEEGIRAVKAWGYPSILKPRNSQSSLGVFKVGNPIELRDRFAMSLKESREHTILVEEFIDGIEITVEGFSLAGQCRVLAISEKEHYSLNPCVARRLAYPPRFDGATLTRIHETAERVVNVLGLEDGISHAEYRMSNGVPYLVEVAARGGGNRIASVIIQHVSGIDVYEMLINRLMGQDVRMPDRLMNQSANLEFLDFAPGKVKAIRGIDEVRRSGLAYEIELNFGAGDTIQAPADDKSRLGYFISLGTTRDEIDMKSARVRELVSIEYA